MQLTARNQLFKADKKPTCHEGNNGENLNLEKIPKRSENKWRFKGKVHFLLFFVSFVYE